MTRADLCFRVAGDDDDPVEFAIPSGFEQQRDVGDGERGR